MRILKNNCRCRFRNVSRTLQRLMQEFSSLFSLCHARIVCFSSGSCKNSHFYFENVCIYFENVCIYFENVCMSRCRTKPFVESSGYRTRPLKPSRYWPRLTQIGGNRKVLQFGVNGTSQTKKCIWGRNLASKQLLGRHRILRHRARWIPIFFENVVFWSRCKEFTIWFWECGVLRHRRCRKVPDSSSCKHWYSTWYCTFGTIYSVHLAVYRVFVYSQKNLGFTARGAAECGAVQEAFWMRGFDPKYTFLFDLYH